MKRHTFFAGLLLASGALALGSVQVPAQAAPDAARAQGVTYRVATGRTQVRAAPRAGAAPAPAKAPRVRPGAPAASGRVHDEAARRPGKVFGADDRYAISDPTAYPWSSVCKVFAEFPDGTGVEGSAVLVGDRFALTAGHVVFDAAYGGFADVVRVVPAYDNGDAPFGSFHADDVTSFSGWTEDGDYDWDFALLALDGDAGVAAGYLGLGAYSDATLSGLTLNTAGYPGDLDDGAFMFGATGTVERVLAGQLQMRGEMDAAQGQSGSGVWVKWDDGRYVAGVVSTETSTYNQVARVTGDVFDALVSWMDGPAGADFTVTSLVAPLPAEFELPQSATATVTVANDGDVGDTVEVAVLARTRLGLRTLIARRDVFVGAGEEIDVGLALDLGAAFPAGTRVLEAEVNGDRAVDESDFTDNTLDGPAFVALPPFAAIDVGLPSYATLGPGGVARQRFVVPGGLRALRLSLAGPRGSFATITRPDGTRFVLRVAGTARSVRTVRTVPLAGEWLVDLRAPVTLRRARAFRFQASPKY